MQNALAVPGEFFPIAHPALGSPLSVVKSVCSPFIFLNLILLIARGGSQVPETTLSRYWHTIQSSFKFGICDFTPWEHPR